MRKIIAPLLMVSLISVEQLFAAGQTTANFLQLGGGARYLAMGEAASAVSDDANSMHWNPANMAFQKDASVSFLYGAFVESSNYQFLTFSSGKKSWGAWGASLQNLSAGSITETDMTGQEIGEFKPRDSAGSLGWSHRFRQRSALGLSAKFVNSKIINQDTTIAFDGGYTFQQTRYRLAATFRNVGGKLKLDQESNALPASGHVGGVVKFNRPIILSVEGSYDKDSDFTAASGLEYVWHLGESALAFRGGYNTRAQDVPGPSGMSTGFGLLWNFFQFDYAWVPLGDLDQTHRFSVTYTFSKAPRKNRTVYRIEDPQSWNDKWTVERARKPQKHGRYKLGDIKETWDVVDEKN